MRDLYRGRQWIITEDTERSFVRITRTTAPFDSLAELEAAGMHLEQALNDARRRCTGVLVDLREGPLRNDPEFEKAMGKLRLAIYRGFKRSAVIVRTAVGKLQVARHAREDQAPGFGAFLDEPDAIAHLVRR
jgi:hypothetical protein